MKRTFQPNNRKRSKKHGFRLRMRTKAGRSGATPSPDQGPLPPVGLIWPIRERSSFRALARAGVDVEVSSMVTCAVVGPTLEPPCVAYAVGRGSGAQWRRNRVRRRLRAAARAHAEELQPGSAYLVARRGSAAAELPYAELSGLAARLRCALREDHAVKLTPGPRSCCEPSTSTSG